MKSTLVATSLVAIAFAAALVPPAASAQSLWCAKVMDDAYPDAIVPVLGVSQILSDAGLTSVGLVDAEDGFVLNDDPLEVVFYDYQGFDPDLGYHYFVTGWEGNCSAISTTLCLLNELLHVTPDPMDCLEPKSGAQNAQVTVPPSLDKLLGVGV